MIPTRRGLLAIPVLLAGGDAAAQQEGRGHGNQGRGQGNQGNHGNQGAQGNQGQRGGGQGRVAPASLGTSELNTIQVWLGVNPGFSAQPLPPGMRNRLAQGKPLPPGIARRAVPPDLLRLLPARPGYEYAMVGTSLVLISVASGVVASILADALSR
jgi:hypothetical protein